MQLQINNIMKKITTTALLLVLTLTITMLLSCGQNKNGGSGVMGGGDDETDGGKAGEILSAADKKRYEDTTVYSNYGYARGAHFCHDTHNLYIVLCSEPEAVRPAHADPLCSHNSESCPYFGNIETMVTVDAEWSDSPLVYLFYGDGNTCSIKETDIVTNTVRKIEADIRPYVDSALYYRGKLYICDGIDSMRSVCSVDPRTGEFKRIAYSGGALLMGIYSDRVWYITDRGVICSVSTELDDMREEYDSGIPEITREGIRVACIDGGGTVYLERNMHAPTEDISDSYLFWESDIYALDIDDKDAGERFVDEDVVRFIASDGSLYYTKLDYEDFGPVVTVDGVELELPITVKHQIGKEENDDPIYETVTYNYTARTVDGGTLYKYDGETDEKTVCYEDCGVSIYEIYDIADGKIFYSGERYRDFTMTNSDYTSEILVMSDLKTGETVVLSHSGSPLPTE